MSDKKYLNVKNIQFTDIVFSYFIYSKYQNNSHPSLLSVHHFRKPLSLFKLFIRDSKEKNWDVHPKKKKVYFFNWLSRILIILWKEDFAANKEEQRKKDDDRYARLLFHLCWIWVYWVFSTLLIFFKCVMIL